MSNYFIYTLIAVFLGYMGLLTTSKNMIFFLVYLEILFNSMLLIFMVSGYASVSSSSVIYFLITLTLIASEAVVGLVLTILYFKSSKNINMYNLSCVNG